MKTSIFFFLILFSALSSFSQGSHIRSVTGIDEARNNLGLTGEGVLVVIIDRGIDYTHPDFIDSAGNTRLEYIFDMVNNAGANDPDNPYGVGTIFDKNEINLSLAGGGTPLSTDRGGHGTATTSIAAGNGSAVPGAAFEGVAPQARIISIKLTQDYFPAFGNQPQQSSFFQPSYIPIALEFARDKIAELGLPAVTLMNIGSIGGPTDGTSLIARKIDEFVEAGNIFVCGVGDDGGAENYAAGTLDANQEVEILISKGEAGFLRMDLWYEEADRFAVSIERPNGTVEGLFAGPAGPNASADQNLGDIQVYHRGANVEFFDATSNRRELMIDFTGPVGVYKVKLRGSQVGGSGKFQATLNPSRYNNLNRFLSFVEPGHSINDYASATKCVVPSDFVAQNTWVDIDGIPRTKTGEGSPGELWLGSSAGPTHDGRRGVDFVTPGEVCFAAYSPDTYYHNFTFNQIQGSNGLYGIQNAVSGAAPVATGILALMLEMEPNVRPDELDFLFSVSCTLDSFVASGPPEAWGYGKLDASALALAAINALNNEGLYAPQVRLYPNPSQDFLQVELINDQIESLEIRDTQGRLIRRMDISPQNQAHVNLEELAEGMYLVLIKGLRQTHTRKMLKL